MIRYNVSATRFARGKMETDVGYQQQARGSGNIATGYVKGVKKVCSAFIKGNMMLKNRIFHKPVIPCDTLERLISFLTSIDVTIIFTVGTVFQSF